MSCWIDILLLNKCRWQHLYRKSISVLHNIKSRTDTEASLCHYQSEIWGRTYNTKYSICNSHEFMVHSLWILRITQGQQGDSVGTGAFHQEKGPCSVLRDPHDGRREMTLANCSLTPQTHAMAAFLKMKMHNGLDLPEQYFICVCMCACLYVLWGSNLCIWWDAPTRYL